MRALAFTLLLGCSHTNSFSGDPTARPGTTDTDPCAAMPCGGTGDALQIRVGAVLLASLLVVKFWRR